MILKSSGRVGPGNALTLRLGDAANAQNVVLPVEGKHAEELFALANDVPIPTNAFFSGGHFDPAAPWPDAPTLVFRGYVIEVKDPFAAPASEAWREEAILRVKKYVLVKERELAALRRDVSALESVKDAESPIREPIPRDVRMLVFDRDGGRCVTCGATSDLQFDHIIPVAKGGGATAANIQILCQRCNLAKGDRI